MPARWSEKSAEAIVVGLTDRRRAEPVVKARDLVRHAEQMPRKRALKPEERRAELVRYGWVLDKACGEETGVVKRNRNRRVRNRTHGGVGGWRP